MALVVVGCNTTDEIPGGEEEKAVQSNYTLILNANGILSSQHLNADAEVMTINSEDTDAFADIDLPELTYRNGDVLGFYHEQSDCSGKVTLHDFKEDAANEIVVFTDIADCHALTVTSLTHALGRVYLSYVIEVSSKDKTYFIRAIDSGTDPESFVDIELGKKPLQMVVANNRVFVLTFDEEETNENGLVTIDVNSNTIINEKNLGYDARQLLVDANKDIIIGYDSLHTLMDSKTLALNYYNYEEGKEPNFATSNATFFNSSGNLYYGRPTPDGIFPSIPAIYDFGLKTVYLYYYENFLTETQLQFEYEIANTTMVSYDDTNDLLLVGYSKTTGVNKGGLLRIKVDPEPELIDSIDLEGVPYTIYMK